MTRWGTCADISPGIVIIVGRRPRRNWSPVRPNPSQEGSLSDPTFTFLGLGRKRSHTSRPRRRSHVTSLSRLSLPLSLFSVSYKLKDQRHKKSGQTEDESLCLVGILGSPRRVKVGEDSRSTSLKLTCKLVPLN